MKNENRKADKKSRKVNKKIKWGMHENENSN